MYRPRRLVINYKAYC